MSKIHRRILPVLTAVALAAISLPPAADVLVLKDGKKIEGEIREEANHYAVTTKFGTLKVTKEDVVRVIRNADALTTQADVLSRTGLELLADSEKEALPPSTRDTKRMAAEATLNRALSLYKDARSVAKPGSTAALDGSIAKVTAALARCRAAAAKAPSALDPVAPPPPPAAVKPAPSALTPPPAVNLPPPPVLPPPPSATAKVSLPEPLPRTDPEAIELQAKELNAEIRAVRTTEEAETLGNAFLALADEAADADLFDLALSLLGRAESVGRQTRNTAMSQQASSRRKAIQPLRTAYQRVRSHFKTLESNPDDPAANTAAALYLCTARQDWGRAIPMLARGTDKALKALAEKEVAGVSETGQMVELGDGWWDASKRKMGSQRNALAGRAVYWYETALPDLTLSEKARVTERLREWTKANPNRPGPAVDLLTWIDTDVHSVSKQSRWSMQSRVLTSAPNIGDLRYTRIVVPCIPTAEYDLTVAVQHTRGEGPFGVGLVAQGRPFAIVLDAHRVTAGLFGGIDSHDLVQRHPGSTLIWRGSTFEGDKPATVVCSVRRNHLRVTVNGQVAIDWKNPPYATASPPEEWDTPKPECLSLISRDVATYRVSQLVLRPVGGGAPRRVR